MTWNDVAGLEFAKRNLEEAIILPQKFPHLFTGKRQPWKGILLHGPPGTGKTHIAKVIASVSGAKFFSVSASDLISKYVGESEKNLKELFHMAMANKPAIIFLDEVDSICSCRKDGEQDATQRFKSEFLIRMNEIANSQGVLVLGATNRPFDLDPAIRRRFEKRIYIPLPDKKARETLFTIHVGDEPVKIGKNTCQKLAQATEGYSGSDISNVVREALFLPLRHAMNATHWKRVKSSDPSIPYLMKPCSPRDPEAIEINMMHLEPETVLLPEITEETFFESCKNIKPTVNKEELEMFQKFTEMYGSVDLRQDSEVNVTEDRNRAHHEREGNESLMQGIRGQGTRGQQGNPKCAIPMV